MIRPAFNISKAVVSASFNFPVHFNLDDGEFLEDELNPDYIVFVLGISGKNTENFVERKKRVIFGQDYLEESKTEHLKEFLKYLHHLLGKARYFKLRGYGKILLSGEKILIPLKLEPNMHYDPTGGEIRDELYGILALNYKFKYDKDIEITLEDVESGTVI